MPTVHAYRRTAAVEIDVAGLKCPFKPNAQGDVIAEVPDGPALKRLLEISEGYRLHGSVPEVQDGGGNEEDDDEHDARFIITDGERQVDLRELTDEQLHAFAAENGIKVHPKAKGETVRTRIIESLNGG